MDQDRSSQIALMVPTLNAGQLWPGWLEALEAQHLRCDVHVIDSGSSDDTVALARRAGLNVTVIEQSTFNHGATRNLLLEMAPQAELLIYLTQDAILAAPDSLQALIAAFDDPQVGVAYGRQLPHRDAGPLGAFARRFNYPAQSSRRTFADAPRLGIKTAFSSNSFAAYRRNCLESLSGFPQRTILGEDTLLAGRALQENWALAYRADACVYHSHDYSAVEEFRRHFDIGVMHSREAWFRQAFGAAEGEGMRFVQELFGHLARHAPWRMPQAALHMAAKYAGYRVGMAEARLPEWLKPRFSMHKEFWATPRQDD